MFFVVAFWFRVGSFSSDVCTRRYQEYLGLRSPQCFKAANEQWEKVKNHVEVHRNSFVLDGPGHMFKGSFSDWNMITLRNMSLSSKNAQ